MRGGLFRGWTGWIVLVGLGITSCAPGGSRRDRGSGEHDAGAEAVEPTADASGGGSAPVGGCSPDADADGDGIADDIEGSGDSDGDGTPNALDTDSDGDGRPDSDEHAGARPCARVDTDGDGTPDFLDLDSDDDGLTDQEELEDYHTDPTEADTDGDGATDLVEVRGSRTDARDPASTVPPEDFFVVLPYQGPGESKPLRFGTDIKIADVYFLVDTTGSMGGAIRNVRESLQDIASQIATRIPDVQMGVGQFRDFPFEGGSSGGLFGGADDYGHPGDEPYQNLQDITGDLSAVQVALDSLRANGGGDGPESHVEALYQTATGEGGTWRHAGRSWDLPPRSCPVVPDEPAARRGYPCFRPGALPILVLVSDAPWHNGPGGSEQYDEFAPTAHDFEQSAVALGEVGARFVGVNVRGGGRSEAVSMAERTGTVDTAGNPLVYEASDGTVSSNIVDGIGSIADGVRQDVGTRIRNVEGNPDDFDATSFIKAVMPIEGFPASGYESKDDIAFYGVVPGTDVEFQVDFLNDVRPPAETAQIFEARIVVVGNRVTDLDERSVYVIVPPDGVDILL